LKRAAWSRLAKLTTAIVFAVVAGVWTVGQLRAREVAHRDQQEVARMTREMKTVCIGRFLIDMPEETRLELARPRIDGFDISSADEPDADFRGRLGQREASLRAVPDRLGGNRNVESARDVRTDNGVVGKIFVHGRTVHEGTQLRGLEQERYRYEHVAVEALVHGQGMSFDLSAEKYDPDQVENLFKLVAKLVPNPTNEAPTEPGFCVYRAWFRDPLTADQGEEIMMHAQLPKHPDIEFLAILAAGNKPTSPGLPERSAQTEGSLPADVKKRVFRLPGDPRTIGGITGDELVRRVTEKNGSIGYTFWWEVSGTQDNVFVPHFVFKMDTGESDNGPVPSSLSQEAGMALWDKILSSIRFHHPPLRQGTRPLPAGSGPRSGDARAGT
jgi:hypothetical protein